MSAVEAALPPRRPPPPSAAAAAKDSQRNLVAGLSRDLESVKLESSSDYDVRRRSMTLGSRPAMRKRQTEPHIIDPRQHPSDKVRPAPHVIDSSGRGKANGKSEEQNKSVPAPRPDRPPPPAKSILRSVSQPSYTTDSVSQQTDEVDKPVLRRRLSSEGSNSSLKRLSGPRRSREMSPLPQLPEGTLATTTPTKTSPTSLSPPPVSTAVPSQRTPSPSSGTISPPPNPLPAPPAPPRRSRALSSPPRATPLPASIPNPVAVEPPKSASPTMKSFTPQYPNQLPVTTPTHEVPPQEAPTADNETVPIVPPRPFRPPRPFPPSAGSKSPKRRPQSAPKPSSIKPNSSPTHTSHRHPRNTGKTRPMPGKSARNSTNGEAGGEEDSQVGTGRPHMSPAKKVSRSPDRSCDRALVEAQPPKPRSPARKAQLNDQPHGQAKPTNPSPTQPPPPPTSPSSSTSSASSPQTEQLRRTEGEEGNKVLVSQDVEDTASKQPQLQREMSTDHVEEKEDMVNPLPPLSDSWPGKKGNKLVSSMKNSFRSLRLKTRKSPDTKRNKRTFSDAAGVQRTNKDYPDPLPVGIIHPIVVQCVAYLNRESVLVEEGLFRVPGDLANIRKLRQEFCQGCEVDLTEVLDPHTVAGLLKLHFREMKASLIPRGLPLTRLMAFVKEQNVEGVREEFEQLEVASVATLSVVIEVLGKIVSHSSVNHMTSGIIATSCGPSLFPYLPPSNANQMTKFLIDHCSAIFHSN